MADKIKLLLAILLVAAGIYGFYYFDEQYALLYRVLGLLLVVLVSTLIGLQTQLGSTTWEFGRSAFVEVRKVVWPTRRETVQTTLVVLAMVAIIGLMLYLFDRMLKWAVELLYGLGG